MEVMHPVHVVELASMLVLAFFVYMEMRADRWRSSLPLGLVLVLAAWVGEDTCIRLYGFYGYSPAWHGILDKMPLMVALIWPFVILSDLRVVQDAFPEAPRAHPLLVGMLVCYDASLMETVAVRAGLWQWTEPGIFGVPVIGILGWGFFACSSLFFWQRLSGGAGGWVGVRGPGALASGVRVPVMVVLAPLVTHALLLIIWWGGLRWVLRGAWSGGQAVGVAVLASTILCAFILRLRIRVPLETMLPRVFAAGVFFWLLFAYGRDDLALVLFVATFVPPYLLATRWPVRVRSGLPALDRSHSP